MFAGVAASTSQTYAKSQQQYLLFCSLIHCQPLPASELILLRFISWLKLSKNIEGVTISNYLSSIRHLHIINNHPDPLQEAERVRLVRKALRIQSTPLSLRIAVTWPHVANYASIIESRFI